MKAITKKLLRTENFLRCVAGVFQKRTQEELASEQASGEEGKIRQAKPAEERESDEFGERSDRGGAGEPVDFYLWSFWCAYPPLAPVYPYPPPEEKREGG